jgi:hypothetical protein
MITKIGEYSQISVRMLLNLNAILRNYLTEEPGADFPTFHISVQNGVHHLPVKFPKISSGTKFGDHSVGKEGLNTRALNHDTDLLKVVHSIRNLSTQDRNVDTVPLRLCLAEAMFQTMNKTVHRYILYVICCLSYLTALIYLQELRSVEYKSE